jgi:hypothetical protein
MVKVTYNKQLTALLVIDPYNDFISEGGKIWDRIHALRDGRYDKRAHGGPGKRADPDQYQEAQRTVGTAEARFRPGRARKAPTRATCRHKR